MHRALLSFFVLGLGLLLCADGWGMSQRDSLWVRGGLTLADSMAVDVEWRLGGQDPEGETDTVWTRISRSDALLAWARPASTQVQLAPQSSKLGPWREIHIQGYCTAEPSDWCLWKDGAN